MGEGEGKSRGRVREMESGHRVGWVRRRPVWGCGRALGDATVGVVVGVRRAAICATVSPRS